MVLWTRLLLLRNQSNQKPQVMNSGAVLEEYNQAQPKDNFGSCGQSYETFSEGESGKWNSTKMSSVKNCPKMIKFHKGAFWCKLTLQKMKRCWSIPKIRVFGSDTCKRYHSSFLLVHFLTWRNKDFCNFLPKKFYNLDHRMRVSTKAVNTMIWQFFLL